MQIEFFPLVHIFDSDSLRVSTADRNQLTQQLRQQSFQHRPGPIQQVLDLGPEILIISRDDIEAPQGKKAKVDKPKVSLSLRNVVLIPWPDFEKGRCR